MNRLKLAGWILTGAGIVLWTYGYLAGTLTPLVDWASYTPGWLSTYLPNLETEIGIVLMLAAMVPMYWPQPEA